MKLLLPGSIEPPPDCDLDSGRRFAGFSLLCSTLIKSAMVEKLEVGVIVIACWFTLGFLMPQDG